MTTVATALPEDENAARPEALPAPIHWNPLLRIGFRFCFCYFLIWIVCNGNAGIWTVVPHWGDRLNQWFHWPLGMVAALVARHVLHLPANESTWIPTGSGDTALDWVQAGVFVSIALVAAAVWSVLDRRRREYQVLLAWLIFLLRLSVATAMLIYGFVKFFPLQMGPPLLITLAEPVGQMSPMNLLWTMIGSAPHYEMICGVTEIGCGVLLLVRRTALAGAILTVFVTTNIVLYNFFFDVPVKLFSLHLLLGAAFCVLPNTKPLFRFFFQHLPAAPSAVWVPPSERRPFRIATLAVEMIFLLLVGGQMLQNGLEGYTHVYGNEDIHSPLQGGWTITEAGSRRTAEPLFHNMQQIYIDRPLGKNSYLAVSKGLPDLRAGMPITIDAAKHQIEMPGPPNDHVFAFAAHGNDQVTLTGLSKSGSGTGTVIVLQRIALPKHWPLLTRGFHLVSQSPYER